jgi:hypothetical protein
VKTVGPKNTKTSNYPMRQGYLKTTNNTTFTQTNQQLSQKKTKETKNTPSNPKKALRGISSAFPVR